MKPMLWLLMFSPFLAQSQKLKKADKVILDNLKTHVSFLADDKLEGRRTGSAGEQLAADYISNDFKIAGLVPKGDKGTFLQTFEVNDGKAVDPASHLVINDNDLLIDKDYFPLACSPNVSMEAMAAMALQETGSPWFYDLKDVLAKNSNNPHFDLLSDIKNTSAEAAKKGAKALIIYNSSAIDDALKFDAKDKSVPTTIPVLYITKTAAKKYLTDETATLDIKLKTSIGDKIRQGHNVVGYIDNNAKTTVIIGAHYDHLGYGEDHNSLFTGSTPTIHNGADDNASGTASIIELSKLLKASKFNSNNYLFIAFSGEELGLYGSKYFAEHPTFDFSNTNYMINMDMIGRLSDSSHGLTIGGYGTSPMWGQLIKPADKFFTIKFDSSGSGPSDHTSFYRKDIPVLFFFTGLHSDYHKPSDDADKINYTGELQVVKYIYNLVGAADKKGKLSFTKTREMQMGTSTNFKVTLGIMPDYTFSGTGVRADGISEGKIAQQAGMKAGDVIVQLGEYNVSEIQTYMQALAKFKKGDATTVKVKRGNEELVFNVIF